MTLARLIEQHRGPNSMQRHPACPQCGSDVRQFQEWRPDTNPTTYRRKCWDCGWRKTWRLQ